MTALTTCYLLLLLTTHYLLLTYYCVPLTTRCPQGDRAREPRPLLPPERAQALGGDCDRPRPAGVHGRPLTLTLTRGLILTLTPTRTLTLIPTRTLTLTPTRTLTLTPTRTLALL